MVKIFVGNLASSSTVEELRSLFSQYGKISECDIVKNFGFVHMTSMTEAEEAIRNLHHYVLNGESMNVEMSKGRPKATTKLHVSNLGEGCGCDDLRAKFEEFGTVVECDIVKDYAFVHMERVEDAMDAIAKLDNTAFKGKLMSVQLSTSRLRTAPGMGDQTGCYVCGRQGHWSKDCPVGRNGHSDGMRGRSGRGLPRGPPGYGSRGGGGGYGMARDPPSGYMDGYSRASYMGGLPPPPRRLSSYGSEMMADRYAGRAAGYLERSSVYDRDRYASSVDYYEKYRARPAYGASYFEDRRLPYPPPPPPPASSLSRLSNSVDPYDRRPPPATAATAGAYYAARDRSPIRRVPASSATYSYERSRLSPVGGAGAPRAASYGAVPRAKEAYAPRYAPY